RGQAKPVNASTRSNQRQIIGNSAKPLTDLHCFWTRLSPLSKSVLAEFPNISAIGPYERR
ncbi:MAG: hypothetical protein WA806_21940, partial [Bradyrhizobium sp.]